MRPEPLVPDGASRPRAVPAPIGPGIGLGGAPSFAVPLNPADPLIARIEVDIAVRTEE